MAAQEGRGKPKHRELQLFIVLITEEDQAPPDNRDWSGYRIVWAFSKMDAVELVDASPVKLGRYERTAGVLRIKDLTDLTAKLIEVAARSRLRGEVVS